MKKNYLKTFIATLLMAVGSINALAADKEYTQVLNLDFEDANTYTSGWTVSSGYSQKKSGTSNYLHLYNNVGASYTFGSVISTSTDYIMEFDCNVGQNNGNGGGGAFLTLNSASGVLMKAEKGSTGWKSEFNIYNSASEQINEATLTGDGYQKEAAFTFFFHYKITGNTTEGTKLTVTKGTETIIDSYQLSTECIAPTSINIAAIKNASCTGIDNVVVSIYSENEIVPVPTASITGVNHNERTISIALGENSTAGSYIEYYTKEDKSDVKTYEAPFTVSTNSDIKYYTVSALGNKSDEQVISVDCSAISLNQPYYTKGNYADGKTVVTLTTDVSGILLSPAASIIYTISDGTTGTITNGSTIEILDGQTVTATAIAEGYENSTELTFTASEPCSAPVIFSETYNGKTSEDKMSLSVGDEIIYNNGNTDFKYIYYGDANTLVSERLLVNSVTRNDLMRTNGLYFGVGRSVVLLDVKAGDYVTMNGVYGNGTFSISSVSNGVKDEWNSENGKKYCFQVNNDGVFIFNLARYGYLQSLTIQRKPETVSLPYEYNTYCTQSALDFTGNEDVEAYTAEMNGEGTGVTLTQVYQVPEGAGVILKRKGEATTANVNIITSADELSGNQLKGVKTPMQAAELVAENAYILVDQLFCRVTESSEGELAAGKAYLAVPANVKAAATLSLGFGNITGATEVEAQAGTMAGEIYNMQGMRVKSATKGIYIIGGKKYCF